MYGTDQRRRCTVHIPDRIVRLPTSSASRWGIVTEDGERRRWGVTDHEAIQFVMDPQHRPCSEVPFFVSPFQLCLGSECTRCQRKGDFYIRCPWELDLKRRYTFYSSIKVGCISCLAAGSRTVSGIRTRVIAFPANLNGNAENASDWVGGSNTLKQDTRRWSNTPTLTQHRRPERLTYAYQ